MPNETTSVLVVGGGLVGLTTALLLAKHDVPTVLVERHPGSSPHPRAIGFNPRTVEILGTAGLAARIPRAPGAIPRRVRVQSLTGQWFEEQHWTPPGAVDPVRAVEHSPRGGAGLAQDRMEPLLRDRAAELGADIRMSTELCGFEQGGDGVLATIRGADGVESTLRADYLVGADGHRSPVREALGIGRKGRGYLRTGRSVLFRAPLEEYLATGYCQFVVEQPGFSGFLTTYADGRWVLFLPDEIGDEVASDPVALRGLIDRATGLPELDVQVITTGRWEITASIADTYRVGRVFLAGDAAHTLPPSRGGYGVNVGMEDAHNLAWKLAAVLSGRSAPDLLDTYEAERRPVAWRCHEQMFARIDIEEGRLAAADATLIDDKAMAFGQLYRSAAVLGAGADLPPALRPEQWAGQPGTRAPHLWLDLPGGDRASTVDLLGHGWVLLADGDAWAGAAERAAAQLGIPLTHHRVGTDVRTVEPDAFRPAFGLEAGGAALVRPDGYIAWRGTTEPADPAAALTEALSRVAAARAVDPLPA